MSPARRSRPLPLLLLAPSALAVAILVVPILGLLGRSPWPTMGSRLLQPEVRRALWLSLLTATAAMAVCVVVGLPLAWVLARVDFRGRALLRALVTVPLVLPPVV